MRYRLAIADDERLIRESLAQFISWEDLGFELVLVAEDGEPVIEALQKGLLDAVLCDIQMQEKTGLDVAEYIWDNGIDCMMVLLSGYEEFEYARRAIVYNVSEYLLKPINLGRIRETFLRIKEELDKKAKDKKSWEQLKEKEYFFRHAAVEQMVEKGMTGSLGNREACSTLLNKFGVDESILEWSSYMMNVTISYLEEYQTFGSDILQNILKLLAGSGEIDDIFMVYGKEEHKFRVLLLRKLAFDKGSGERYLDEVVRAVRDIFGTQAQASFEADGISLEEMMKYLGDHFAAVEECSGEPVNKADYLDMISRQYLMIMNMCSEPEEMRECLDQICGKQHKRLRAEEDLKEILLHMHSLFEEQFPDRDMVMPVDGTISEKEFREVMEQYYYCLRDCGNDGASLVERVKKLVKEKIGENIALSSAAEHVFLSPNYFSRIFKEQTGENFSEYCIRIKMEKAAEMIKVSSKKVYEIGEELGYQNIKYFYKLFKRTYSCTPLEYRKKYYMGAEGYREKL